MFGPEFGHGKPLERAPLLTALEALGAPHTKLPPVIHVAGTNGKGSTIAFMRAIAEAAGLKVHAFTKPHLFQLNERFVVGSEIADDEALIAAAERVRAVGPDLSQFDAQVAAAFLLFASAPADLVLLETGMGGRDDSTNVIAEPAVSVITPIGLDHQDALGATLAEIAAHKAGIIRRIVTTIVARQPPEVMAVLDARASEVRGDLRRQGEAWDAFESNGHLVIQTDDRMMQLPLPKLQGHHQIANAGLACMALLSLRDDWNGDAFAAGVAGTHWPARLQPLTRGPFSAPIRALGGEVWVDGGHNAHAAYALSRSMKEMKARRGGANVAIVGLRKRKDALSFIAALAQGATHVIAVPLPDDHISVHEIAKTGYDLGLEVDTAASLAAAMQNAAQLPAPRVLICGSFLLAAEALAAESA